MSESPLAKEELVPDDEFVPEDDRIIGVVFRRSLMVLAGAAVLAALAYLLIGRSETEAPEHVIEASAPEEVAAAAEAPELRFTDVAAEAGVDFVHRNGGYGDKLLPETMGGGVAFLDYDADGDEDLLFVNSGWWPHHRYAGSPPTMALYANDGGRFRDVTREAGLDASFYGMGAAAADYDADGDADVFLTAVGANRLYRNDGGSFTDVTAGAGVAGGADEWSTSAGFFDYDGDGDLDLMVLNYVRWSKEIDFELDFRLTGVGRAFGPPQNYEGTYPYLYRNDGPGAGFTEVSAEAGLHVDNPATGLPMAKSLALSVVDVEGDGDLDVLVANDTVRNFLFRNEGPDAGGTVRFAEEGQSFGIAYDRSGNASGAMGVDAAYYRNDQNLAFLIGNFANEMSSVYVAQDHPEIFVDEAIGEGIGAPSRRMLTFGVFFFDADLDGRLDLLQTNGHLEEEIGKVDPSQAYRQPAQLFWNAGDRGFVAVDPAATGDLGREIVGRGAAYADVDGDGDLDVVLTQISGPPLLLRNDQDLGHHWLRVRLEGRPPNREAIGARVELAAGGVTQRRWVAPAKSYLSQVERTVTFGLGADDRVDSLKVIWPDGSEQEVADVEVDRLRVVEQAS